MPHLIVFCQSRWSFVYQRPQQLLLRLAKHFEVLFVEEPMKGEGQAWLTTSHVAPRVTVLKPHTGIDAPGFHDDQLQQLEPMISGYLRDNGIDDYVVWFYTPMALPLLADLSPRAVVFDCMDEPCALQDTPRQLRQREAALMKRADLVLTGGPGLYEAKRGLHPNVMCLPSAVDAPQYAPDRATANIEAMLQAEQIQGRILGPRLGFFGAIDERVDLELVAAVADADPHWQLVMVGPVVKIDPLALPQRPNIHWLGGQPDALLPQLVADWDVCLLPFAINEATRFTSSTRTLEYMAAEKPVVSTGVRDVVAMYGDVVRIGHNHRAFIEGCRWALSETAMKRAERVREMNATVARYSWDNTAHAVWEAIAKVLNAQHSLRDEASPERSVPDSAWGELAAVGTSLVPASATASRPHARPALA